MQQGAVVQREAVRRGGGLARSGPAGPRSSRFCFPSPTQNFYVCFLFGSSSRGILAVFEVPGSPDVHCGHLLMMMIARIELAFQCGLIRGGITKSAPRLVIVLYLTSAGGTLYS